MDTIKLKTLEPYRGKRHKAGLSGDRHQVSQSPCISHADFSSPHANRRSDRVVAFIYCTVAPRSFAASPFPYPFATKPNYSKTSLRPAARRQQIATFLRFAFALGSPPTRGVHQRTARLPLTHRRSHRGTHNPAPPQQRRHSAPFRQPRAQPRTPGTTSGNEACARRQKRAPPPRSQWQPPSVPPSRLFLRRETSPHRALRADPFPAELRHPRLAMTQQGRRAGGGLPPSRR